MSEGRNVVPKDFWETKANEYADEEKHSGGQFISTAGGILKFGEDEMPNNQMLVIITHAVREHTFYQHAYDPEHSEPPVCYAFGESEREMEPAFDLIEKADPQETWFVPQAETCGECKWNEWGSAEKGAGKRCQQRRRLALIPAGLIEYDRKSKTYEEELFDDERDLAESDMAFLKIPVTSVKNWSKYVQALARNPGRPPYGVITRISIERHPKFQFEMKFEMVDVVPDHLAQIVYERNQEAREDLIQPYLPPQKDSAKGGVNPRKREGKGR
jgi:hypothetical protein